MRYETRFRNGVWTLFDWHRFEAVQAFSLKREADAAAKRANKV